MMPASEITFDVIHHHLNDHHATPYVICGSVKTPSSKYQEQLICASLAILCYRKNVLGTYQCKLPHHPSSTLTVTLQLPSPVPLKYRAFYIAIRGTYSFSNIITGFQLITHTNVYLDLKKIKKTNQHIERIIRPYLNSSAKYFVTGHSAGGVYTLKLLIQWHKKYSVTVYNFNPAIISQHIKQLKRVFEASDDNLRCKIYMYRMDLDIVSYQYGLCKALCDKKWMRVVVFNSHHVKENDAHADYRISWINEVISSHKMNNFIHIREDTRLNAILQNIPRTGAENNKKLLCVLQKFLQHTKEGYLHVLKMLRQNLHKAHKAESTLLLPVEQSPTRRSCQSIKKRRSRRKSTTDKLTKYDMSQLVHNYHEILRE